MHGSIRRCRGAQCVGSQGSTRAPKGIPRYYVFEGANIHVRAVFVSCLPCPSFYTVFPSDLRQLGALHQSLLYIHPRRLTVATLTLFCILRYRIQSSFTVRDLHREVTPASSHCKDRLYHTPPYLALHDYTRSYSRPPYTGLTTIHLTPKRSVPPKLLCWLSTCVLRPNRLAHVKAKERSLTSSSA